MSRLIKHIANNALPYTLIASIVLFLAFVQCSCRTQRIAGETAIRDSVRVVQRLDSIYIYERDSVYIREKGDTVWLERWSIRYRDVIKEVHDTCYIDRVRETTIEMPYVTKAQRNMIAGFWTLLAILIIAVALLAWKNWGKVRTWWMKIVARIIIK